MENDKQAKDRKFQLDYITPENFPQAMQDVRAIFRGFELGEVSITIHANVKDIDKQQAIKALEEFVKRDILAMFD